MLNRIYCDGIFDLFHKGHLKHLEKIHKYFSTPIYLIVGLISDNIATEYKRKPIFNENQRYKILSSCIYINEVIITDQLVIDELFINKYQIDFIVHAFNNKEDSDNQNIFFKIPILLKKFIEIDYNIGISTTQIIKNNKVKENENINFESEIFINNIISLLKINNNDKILELGCGSGLLAYYVTDYIGVNYSESVITNNCVINFRPTDIIFKDKYFNFTVILEYVSDINEVIEEIERVTKTGIYIGNITINVDFFINRGYNIVDSLYDRYDVYKLLIGESI